MNKIWKKNIFWIAVIIVACIAGCEDFWTTGDQIIQDVNDIAGGTRAVLESPAGLLIPPSIRLYGEIGVMLASGLVLTWQQLRNRNMKKTTKAIVKGIEQTVNPEKTTSEVKSNIANEMRKQGGDKFYARANKIVDKLKIS